MLKHKSAIVTGSTSGIGLGIARALAQQGADILLNGFGNAATKHGLIGLSKTVAVELAEFGITSNTICPGYVKTPLVDKQIADQAKAHGISPEQVVRDVMLSHQARKQFIQVDELAALAVFLASDAAVSMTGTALAMDGGWTLH